MTVYYGFDESVDPPVCGDRFEGSMDQVLEHSGKEENWSLTYRSEDTLLGDERSAAEAYEARMKKD